MPDSVFLLDLDKYELKKRAQKRAADRLKEIQQIKIDKANKEKEDGDGGDDAGEDEDGKKKFNSAKDDEFDYKL